MSDDDDETLILANSTKIFSQCIPLRKNGCLQRKKRVVLRGFKVTLAVSYKIRHLAYNTTDSIIIGTVIDWWDAPRLDTLGCCREIRLWSFSRIRLRFVLDMRLRQVR